MAHQLTRKQIYEMRGKLKAPLRYARLVKRYDDQNRKYETMYQRELAKRVNELM